jgi:hypothetical protein
MQKDTVILQIIASVLHLIRYCKSQAGGWFVFPQSFSSWFGLGPFSLSADLDSGRLDVVSRSLWWNGGSLKPRPVPAVVLARFHAPVNPHWRGGPPNTLPRWDH